MIYFVYLEIIVNRCKLYVRCSVTKNIGRIGGRLRGHRIRVDAGPEWDKILLLWFL